jgi:hypothetical protein
MKRKHFEHYSPKTRKNQLKRAKNKQFILQPLNKFEHIFIYCILFLINLFIHNTIYIIIMIHIVISILMKCIYLKDEQKLCSRIVQTFEFELR